MIIPRTKLSIANESIVNRQSDETNILVLYKKGDTDGKEIAEYYVEKRNIPLSNLLGLDTTWTISSSTFTEKQIRVFHKQIADHIKNNNLIIRAAVLCGLWPVFYTQETIWSEVPYPSNGGFWNIVGGTNYTDPTVVVSGGGGGYGLEIKPYKSGNSDSVAAVNFTSLGVDYTEAPTVTFSAPPSGITAEGTCNYLYLGIPEIPYWIYVNITNPGSGYVTPPTVTFSGGGGTGLEGEAVLATGSILGADIVNIGIEYTANPTLTINDPTGYGASLSLNVIRQPGYKLSITDPLNGCYDRKENNVPLYPYISYNDDPTYNGYLNLLYYNDIENPIRLFFLSPLDPDTANGAPDSVVSISKKIIDDSIEAEESNYNSLYNMIFNGSSSYNGLSYAVYPYLLTKNIPKGTSYFEEMAADVKGIARNTSYADTLIVDTGGYYYYVLGSTGNTASVAPTFSTVTGSVTKDGGVDFCCLGPIPSDTFAGTSTSVMPRVDKIFNSGDYSDILFHFIGTLAYYRQYPVPGTKPLCAPKLNDFIYKKGAIVFAAQSFGATPDAVLHADWDYTKASNFVTATDVNCLCVDASTAKNGSIKVANKHGHQTGALVFNRSPGPSTATISELNGVFTFKENGVTVATIDCTGKTLRDSIIYLHNNKPSNWTVGTGQSSFSLAANAIRSGAAFAIGALQEPFVSGMCYPSYFVNALWEGMNILDASYFIKYYGYSNVIFGDPLYAPYKHRRKRI